MVHGAQTPEARERGGEISAINLGASVGRLLVAARWGTDSYVADDIYCKQQQGGFHNRNSHMFLHRRSEQQHARMLIPLLFAAPLLFAVFAVYGLIINDDSVVNNNNERHSFRCPHGPPRIIKKKKQIIDTK